MPSLRQGEKHWKPNSQGYCRQIAEEFPGAVTFITFQGEEQVYDVDFQVLKDSLDGPCSIRIRGLFSLREVAGDVRVTRYATRAIATNAVEKMSKLTLRYLFLGLKTQFLLPVQYFYGLRLGAMFLSEHEHPNASTVNYPFSLLLED